jgi:glycosyltransferase involved in cell wall biosynthesis
MTMHAVVSGWLLGPPSGANRRLLSLLSEAASWLDEGERITALHRPDYQPPTFERVSWHAVDIPCGPTWKRLFQEQRRLRPLLRELGATVYDHGFLSPPRVGLPTCLTIHDVRAADGESSCPSFLARSVLRKSLRRATAVITVSEWTAQRIRDLAPGSAPHIVRNGVRHREPGPLKEPIGKNGYVLHVGHLQPRKNLRVLVEALAEITKTERPELWFVGRDAGEWRPLRKLADRLGVSAFVRHVGVVSDDCLPAYYEDARLLVMPSRYEGFGLPVLEALVHGTPVAAANTTALPEIIGDGALLPIDDAKSWANAMVATPREELEVIQRRAAKAAELSWSEASRQWLDVLRKLNASMS